MNQILSQLNLGVQNQWTDTQKNKALRNLQLHLSLEKKYLAQLLMEEVGKIEEEALLEVEKSLTTIDYVISTNIQTALNHFLSLPKGYEAYLEPLGVILAIMPWNFPLWQLFRVLPWNFWVGNSVLHKNSIYVPRLAEYLNHLIQEHLSNEKFATICPTDEEVEVLISHPQIHGVTFTGSTQVGRKIGKIAGFQLKKCVLELGGSDPFIVSSSVDIQNIVSEVIAARMINNGQSCIAAKRIIVHSSIYQKFIHYLCENLRTVFNRPLIHSKAQSQLLLQVERAQKEGAQVHWVRGFLQFPVVIEAQGNEDFFFEEEFFGPVFTVTQYHTLEQAIQLANRTQYGLGASAWGFNSLEKEIIKSQIQAGFLCFDQPVRSLAAVPFGGYKASGLGYEMGMLGFLEFAKIKIIKE